MKDIRFEIISNRSIAKNTYEISLKCGIREHKITKPGQFVNIKLEGFYLRRPLSVCDWTEDTLTIIYKTVGKGTEYMSKLQTGANVDILTPLGNGYDTSKSGKRPLLIGGGAGIPPMYGLCKTLINENKTPIVIMGFNTENEIFYKEKFKALGIKTFVTTVDGSYGVKGFVTDALRIIDQMETEALLPYTYFYACGPHTMLKALEDTIDKNVDGQMSFEERMGCGFGACMGCSCETKYGSKRICKDGPVLERGEIIW